VVMAKDAERGLGSFWRSFIDEIGLLAAADDADAVF